MKTQIVICSVSNFYCRYKEVLNLLCAGDSSEIVLYICYVFLLRRFAFVGRKAGKIHFYSFGYGHWYSEPVKDGFLPWDNVPYKEFWPLLELLAAPPLVVPYYDYSRYCVNQPRHVTLLFIPVYNGKILFPRPFQQQILLSAILEHFLGSCTWIILYRMIHN